MWFFHSPPASPRPALFGRCLRQARSLLSSAATKQLTLYADVWCPRNRGNLNPSPDVEKSRFGPGVYFWENSFAAAVKWVVIYYHTSEYGVIRASVKCLSLLDLLTVEHFEVLETVRARLAQQKNLKVEEVRHAAVLSFLSAANIIDGARLVAGVRHDTRIHSESKLAGPFEVMICVYNLGNIVVSEFADHSTGRPVR